MAFPTASMLPTAVATKPGPTPTLVAPLLPDYIEDIRSEPGSRLSLSTFEADETIADFKWQGPARTRPGSNICLSLRCESLAFRDDKNMAETMLNDRIVLVGDGEVLEGNYAEVLPIRIAMIEEKDGEEIRRYQVPSPRMICWHTNFGPEVHELVYRYELAPNLFEELRTYP